MNTFWQQTLAEVREFIRMKSTMFWTFMFPAFFILLFGFLNFGTSSNVRYINYLLPAMIMMALITTCITSTVLGFVSDREKGYYRRLFATPLKKWVLLGSQIVCRFFIVLLQTIFLIVIAMLVFGATMPGKTILFWIVLFFGIVTFLCIGFLIASIVRKVETAMPVAMIVFFIMIFLGGAFWPINIMPSFLQKVSKLLPSTYLNDALFQSTVLNVNVSALGQHFLVLAIWGGVCITLAIILFKWE